MLCGRRLVWRKSISQIFDLFLLGFSITYNIRKSYKELKEIKRIDGIGPLRYDKNDFNKKGVFPMDSRTSKQNYYLDIADSVLERSTCLRRKYGAIIVRNDEIISTGYNGAPRGRRNCSDLGYCMRENLHIPSGERYELCRSVHAEANAIISAPRRDMIGATIYLVGRDAKTNELMSDAMSCSMCKRQIINAGIDRVVIRQTPTEYRTIPVSDWVENDDSIFML